MISHLLFDQFKWLLEYCSSKEFDQGMFKVRTKNFTDMYKKADYKEQGEYHRLVALLMT